MREELQNEVDSMLEMGLVMVKKIVLTECVRKLNKITEVDPEPMITDEDLFC